MRIGVDLGGTKIEAIALDDAGVETARRRIATGGKGEKRSHQAEHSSGTGLTFEAMRPTRLGNP